MWELWAALVQISSYTCLRSGPSNSNPCLRCLLLHSWSRFSSFQVAKKQIYASTVTPSCVLFYENKTPVNSCRFYALSSYEVKFWCLETAPLRNASMQKYKVCTKVCKLILTAGKLPIALLFFFVTLNLQRIPGAPSRLGCYQRSATLAEYLPALSTRVPFSTLNWNSPPGLALSALSQRNRKKGAQVRTYSKKKAGVRTF